ncbi:MAG: tetratricopeptide repeat protein, partial [Ignavibacteriae bacterium]|nr:tetratricopeptide repeat protein [Ignavibacteriota bacterium]
MAVSFFIAGKTAEQKEDFRGALENYRIALRYENSPGIHFAISNINIILGNYQDALIDINNALKLSPGNTEFLEQQAKIYNGTGKYVKAAEIYEDILSREPENIPVLYSLARVYQEQKLPARAIVIYEKITDVYGFDFDVLKRMYDIYFNYKDFEKCTVVLEYLLKLDPYDTSLRLELANLYTKMGRDDDAKRIYEEQYSLNPGNRQIQSEMVKIYFRNNEIEKGFSNFARIIGKDSLVYEEKVQLGEMYYNVVTQDNSAMDIVFNIFSKLNKDYPEKWIPYFYLGQIDAANKDKSSAAKKFETAIKYADTTREAYLQIGYTLFNIERYDEAKEVLRKGLFFAGDDYRMNYFYGLVLQRLGNLQEAVTYFEKSVEYDEAKEVLRKGLFFAGDDYRMNYFYGLVLQRLGNLQEAVTYFEKSVELKPDDLGILSSLAMAYNTLKRFKESDEIHDRALKLDPENALILNNYAYNLSVRCERLDDALDMARVAVNKEPGNPSYLDTIGWIY